MAAHTLTLTAEQQVALARVRRLNEAERIGRDPMRYVNERAALREALRALLAGYDHTLPAEWRRARPVSLARAALALGEGAE